jgi:protocatechuate 3,4-dioxygenase beta subunit
MPGPKPGAKARVVATAPGFLQGRSEPVSATVGQRVENVAVRMRIGAYLEGKVTDDRGRPIEGALVRWLKTEGLQEWEIGWRIQSQQPSVTDSEGRYRTEGVEPGRVMVQIEETKHLPFTAKDVATDEGKAAVVDAKLTLGGVIEGRVVGTDGKPVSGAGVSLSFRAGEDQGMQWGDRDRVTSDTEGKFRAEGLKPGQYELQATSRGWAPSEKATVSADASPVTLRLQAALRLGGVVRVRGAPVSGVQVSAMRAVGPDPGQDAARNVNAGDRFEQAASAESGGDGKFLFEELPAGNYRLDFSPRGWGENRPNVVRKSVPDVAAGNEGLVVDLESGLLITGTVTVEDGSPASSGWVNATQVSTDGKPIERPANAWSQLEGGKFEIVGLAPGTYDVHVNVQGHGNKRVRAESGGPELKIVVGVGAKITGKIVREDGTAATNTWVQASMEGAAEGAVTDAEGRYTITGLEPGSYRLNAQSMGPAGGALGSVEAVQVRAGDTVEAPAITLHPAQPAAPVPPGDK